MADTQVPNDDGNELTDELTPDIDEELSSYGVFVKAGPEDVQSDEDDAQFADLAEIDIDEESLDLSDLSEEEEDLLGALEED